MVYLQRLSGRQLSAGSSKRTGNDYRSLSCYVCQLPGVRAFRQGHYKGQIGIVHSFGPVDGIDDSLATKIAMRFADNYANNWILDTAAKEKFLFDLLCVLSQKYDLSFIKDEQLVTIKERKTQWIFSV